MLALAPPDALNFTEDQEANKLLATDPLAVLIGMLLDQQIQMEIAFRSPYVLQQRLGSSLDAPAIAAMDPEDLVEIFREKPALHRFPASMAKRTHQLCVSIAETYAGEAALIWAEAVDGADLYKRLLALPGFGEAKARIFIGLLGKRLDVRPDGWQDQAATWPSIADVEHFDDVLILRQQKRARKEAAKAKKKA